MSENGKMLEVRGLATHFHTEQGRVRAVDGIDFSIQEGQTMALVGESGCGKSVTALSILRLIQDPPGKIERGEILFRGKDILKLSEKEMRSIRGNDIAMIFQEPMTSLNPVYTIGAQIVEAIELHQGIKGAAAWERAVKMLDLVGIADAAIRVKDYPHQMSGGMRQRIMIAMALSCDPSLLIADEPTTALDVTIQAQVLELIRGLQKKNRMSVLLITHDLAVVAENADEVAVMYASRVVEQGPVEKIFDHPGHPYTIGLMNSLPKLEGRRERLEVISGSVPDPLRFPKGCKFHPRCPFGKDDAQCRSEEPVLEEVEDGHFVACWKVKEVMKDKG